MVNTATSLFASPTHLDIFLSADGWLEIAFEPPPSLMNRRFFLAAKAIGVYEFAGHETRPFCPDQNDRAAIRSERGMV
jgi:hypothetical protein